MACLEEFTRSRVKNEWGGVFCDLGNIEPTRAMVKNRNRLHANTERSNEVKNLENLCKASKMLGLMDFALLGTCACILSMPRIVRCK